MNEYDQQALKFLEETNTEFKAEFLKHGKHFNDDDERDIYKITLKRGERVFKFNFGQSVAESGIRLFHDREKTKRTNHKCFKIPQEVMETQKRLDISRIEREKETKRITMFGKHTAIRMWFEREHFVLAGLTWDLGKKPTAYDILAGLTSYEVGTFEDFCGEFGYEIDSIKAEKVYHAVVKEWENIKMLYTDEEIEKLQEIQ